MLEDGEGCTCEIVAIGCPRVGGSLLSCLLSGDDPELFESVDAKAGWRWRALLRRSGLGERRNEWLRSMLSVRRMNRLLYMAVMINSEVAVMVLSR